MFKAKGIMLVSTENKDAKNRDDTQNSRFKENCRFRQIGNVSFWNFESQ